MNLSFHRKLWQSLLLGCLFFLCSQFFVWARSPVMVVKVGIYENSPKIYRDETGKVTGLYGDILGYIAKQENWQIDYVDGSFDEGLNRLKTGEINIMVDVAYSDQRALDYDLTKETVFGSWGTVYVRKDSTINSFKALNGKKIALVKSSIYRVGPDSIDQYIKAFGLDIQLVETAEYPQVFELLSTGQVDAVVVSRISGLAAEAKYSNIKSTNIIFNPTELRFALTKGDPDSTYLIERLDYWVKQLHEEQKDVYAQILQKNGLGGMVEKVEIVPNWIYPTILVGLIVLIVSWAIIWGFNWARRMALKLLAQKEWYLSKLVKNTPIMLSTMDKDGIITFFEGNTLQTKIDNSNSIVGKSVFEVFSNEVATKALRQTLAGEEVQFEVSIGERVYRIFAYPVVQKNGQVTEVALIGIDITEASYLDKAKREFIYIVQHQLRTPPTVIKWNLEILKPKIFPLLEKAEKKNWEMMDEANTRMINLANSISRISEIESGIFPIKIESFVLTNLIEEIIEEFKALIKARKIEVKTNFANMPAISMDRAIIGIIVQTLISNAIHYTKESGFIKIQTMKTPDSWVLEVEDNGPGLPEEIKNKLFTPFSRGYEASKFYPEGIGMELYTTKLLLQNIGGKIWYESVSGKGTTFYIEIPKTVKLINFE